MPHIAILVHRYDSFENTGYILSEIAEIWRKSGLPVSVLQGPGACIDADIAILHVDSTVVPDDHQAFIQQYPTIINGRVTDISKHLISRHRVHSESEEGPVIVKTNRNYRGRREAYHALRGLLPQRLAEIRLNYTNFLKEIFLTVKGLLSRGHPGILRGYPIFEAASQVPLKVRKNSDLIVERFLPERRDGCYCVRTWMFFGDREKHALFYSKEPIINSNNIFRHQPLPDVPEELRQIRRELGFDFGKFDYAIVEGKTILYDVNRTPTLGHFSREKCSSLIQCLSEGIGSFVKEKTHVRRENRR